MKPREERIHIEAIGQSIAEGFQFRVRKAADGTAMAVLYAVRYQDGAYDTYTVRTLADAVGERFRIGQRGGQRAQPLWRTRGTVAEVITKLLLLPAHNSSEGCALAFLAQEDLVPLDSGS